jgi:hypothetical protein
MIEKRDTMIENIQGGSMRSVIAIVSHVICLSCVGKRDAGENTRAAASRNTCSAHPTLPNYTAGHVRLLARIFTADRKAGRTTFGFQPPDSSDIALVTDPQLCARADSALYSALVQGAPQSTSSDRSDTGNLYLYRARNLYAVTDVSQSDGGDLTFAPIFFFFDTAWRYLGNRVN